MDESPCTPEYIAQLIRHAPGWVRVGLTAPVERQREEATTFLAEYLSEGLRSANGDDGDQFPLPL